MSSSTPYLLAFALVLAYVMPARAQTAPANAPVVIDVPATIVACRSLPTGREVCDRTAPIPNDWRIIADRQLHNRVPSPGGLVPEEGLSRVSVTFVRHDVTFVEIIITLTYGLLDPQQTYSSGTGESGVATALASALLRSLPRINEGSAFTSAFVVAYFYANTKILSDPSLPPPSRHE